MNKEMVLHQVKSENSWKELKEIYNSPGRFYHSWEHIIKMFEHIPNEFSKELYYAILFHDVEYTVGATDNEEKSAEYAYKWLNSNTLQTDSLNIQKVKDLIMLTKNHQPHFLNVEENEPDYFWIVYLDLKVLLDCDFNEMKKNDEKLFKEYQTTPLHKYKEGRVLFLESFYTKFEAYIKDERGFKQYIENLKSETFNIGVYCGSFDPLHIGHINIIEKAEKVFDKVILGISQNPEKSRNTSLANLHNKSMREVIDYDTIPKLFEYLKKQNPNDKFTLIRGIRNSWDLQQEDSFREWVKTLSENTIDIIYFFCDRDYEFISSSGLRLMKKSGIDVEKYFAN